MNSGGSARQGVRKISGSTNTSEVMEEEGRGRRGGGRTHEEQKGPNELITRTTRNMKTEKTGR